jgi:hypothetical protein
VHDERGSLPVREVLHLVDELREPLALRDDVRRLWDPVVVVVELLVVPTVLLERVDGEVVRDAVEPRAQPARRVRVSE